MQDKYQRELNNPIGAHEILPVELWKDILSFLNQTELARASLICHLFYDVFRNEDRIRKIKAFADFCAKHVRKQNAVIKLPGNLIAIGSWDGSIRIWDYSAGGLIKTLSAFGTSATIHDVICVAYLGNDRLISSTYAGSHDANLNIQNFRTGEHLKMIPMVSRTNCIVQLTKNELALALDNREVCIFDYESGLASNQLKGHSGYV